MVTIKSASQKKVAEFLCHFTKKLNECVENKKKIEANYGFSKRRFEQDEYYIENTKQLEFYDELVYKYSKALKEAFKIDCEQFAIYLAKNLSNIKREKYLSSHYNFTIGASSIDALLVYPARLKSNLPDFNDRSEIICVCCRHKQNNSKAKHERKLYRFTFDITGYNARLIFKTQQVCANVLVLTSNSLVDFTKYKYKDDKVLMELVEKYAEESASKYKLDVYNLPYYVERCKQDDEENENDQVLFKKLYKNVKDKI